MTSLVMRSTLDGLKLLRLAKQRKTQPSSGKIHIWSVADPGSTMGQPAKASIGRFVDAETIIEFLTIVESEGA